MSHEFRLPDIGEGLTDAEIVAWSVSVGDEVSVDDPIVEIETAKTTVEITSTHAGTVLSLGGAPGDTINVGDVLFVIGTEHESESQSATSKADSQQPRTKSAKSEHSVRVRAMPIVRKLARENGVDLATITGTGPDGAVTRADVEDATQSNTAETLEPLSRIRRRIARHMTESWTTIPHVTVQADIRAEKLLAARQDRIGRPVSLEAIVGGAVLPLLKRYREFNASMHDNVVEYKDHYHLGIAVDTAAGLMVVVVENADTLKQQDLAVEIDRLAKAAVSGSLTPKEATGQTFTISNIGALGGGHGTPIIPLGTSAILSIGRAKQVPVVADGAIEVGMVAPIDLSYDHRLIDGGLGQRFLSALVADLEYGDVADSPIT